MIEILSETFAANETKTFMFQGGYIEILDAMYPVNVYLMDRSGGQISTMRNAEASFFSRPGPFEVIQINSPTAQTVRFFVGSGDAGTRRASGVVQVVDGGKARTLAGSSYSVVGYQGAVAGQYSHVQLWNPSATRRVVVEQVMVTGTSGNFGASLYLGNVALGAHSEFASRKAADLAVAGDYETRILAGPIVTGKRVGLIFGTPYQSPAYKLSEPVILPPGWGLHAVLNNAVNLDLGVTFEFFDENT